MEKRRERIWARIEAADVGGFLTYAPENRYYITGFTGSSGYVLMTAQETVLLTDSRYAVQATAQAQGATVVMHAARWLDTLREQVKRLAIRRLGFEPGSITYKSFLELQDALPGIELVPQSDVVERLRMVKEASELERIADAAKIADDAFAHIAGYIRAGVSERDVALELEIFMRKQGAAGISFTTIVASGERSALPHGVATDRVIGRGDFVTLDFGARYNQYASDITRTVVIGPPSDRHQDVYALVLRAQERALAGIKPGMSGEVADALARDVIEDGGYGDYFGHSLGHGLGIAVHEAPRLARKSEDVLQEGMVVTVEPGIYIPGFGGVRIEDDIVLTTDGCARLTHATKELLIL